MIGYLVEEFGAEPLALPDCPNEITPSTLSPYPCYRMMPHRVRGEGLFLAVLRKSEDEAPARGSLLKEKAEEVSKFPQKSSLGSPKIFAKTSSSSR